jgi:hypothetical protein
MPHQKQFYISSKVLLLLAIHVGWCLVLTIKTCRLHVIFLEITHREEQAQGMIKDR